jgi:putative DNA primase/helicase
MNGSTNKVNHITASTIEAFDLRNFIDRLEPTKEKNRYICPVCGGNNLTISDDPSKVPPPYQCWNNCDCADIREAVAPWEEKTGRRTGARPKKKATPQPKEKIPAPLPIPFNTKLVLLSQRATDAPQPQKPSYIPKPVKAKASENVVTAMETVYKYSETQSVVRFDWEDKEKDKGRDKTFVQTHIDSNGRIIWRKGDAPWYGYKQDEATDAAEETLGTPAILWVEGEKNVEIARSVGIAAISAQGSNWREADLRVILDRLKEDLGQPVQIFLTDNDNNGTGDKKGETFALACRKAGLPFLVIPCRRICHNIPNKGDIEQILQNMDGDELIKLLQQQILGIIETQAEPEPVESESEQEIPESNPDVAFTQKALNFLYGDKPWISADGKLYYWDGNHYRHSPDSVERPKIASYCDSFVVFVNGAGGRKRPTYPYANPAKVEEVLRWVKMRVEINPDLLNQGGINCTNGVIGVKWENGLPVRYIEAHDPKKHYFTYEPLVEYNAFADTTDCERLLECLDEPQQQVLLRVLGASIDLPAVRKCRGREIRILLACGLGSNGKDALRQTVSIIFGHKGMTSVSLADFAQYDEGRKFAVSSLRNSRVNWASENPQTARLDTIQSLKLLATGNVLHSERKGIDHIEFTPNAVAIFNLNHVPSLQGTIQAIQDRFAVLEFRKTFKKNPNLEDPSELQADPRFAYDDEFVRTNVAPAFLNKMLDALEALIAEGIDYECTTDAFRAIQKENNHLIQFCEDIGLVYGDKTMTAMDIWVHLEQWYINNGTLTVEDDGKKRIWAEQAKPSDKNVKAPNQVLARIRQIFPKAKLVTVPHPSGKKNVQALQGLSIITQNTPTPVETDSHPNSTPIPPQSPPQQILTNQGFHPTHPSLNDIGVEKKNDISSSSIEEPIEEENTVDPKVEKNPPSLGWVGCDAHSASVSGLSTGVETGVETGVGEKSPQSETSEPISLLMVEETGGDIAPFVGCMVEVRCVVTGKVKYFGEMIGYDDKNGLITINTSDGEKLADYRESFVL